MPETHGNFGEETARFQAFRDRNEDLPARHVKARGGRTGLLAVIVIVVAVLALIVGKLLIG